MASHRVNGNGLGLPNTRPMLYSQQSSSVPSTPHQRPRRGFGSGSRSPSPRGLSGSQSPRSVHSELHGASTTLQKSRPFKDFCRYENIPAQSRRRIPYKLGADPLDKPLNEPKESLNAEEEEKLTTDMLALYEKLLPTAESERRRALLVEKLKRLLHKQWPGDEFDIFVFGSSGNMLCTSESDVDICIKTACKELQTLCDLAKALDKSGMEHVQCIPAKVPIVKFWDPEYKLAADINVNNTLALENTRMIKTYIQIDERARPLAMIIKHWTKQRILNDAGIGGTISSYAWICLILNFLQTRSPPILPSLHSQSHQSHTSDDGPESEFDDSLERWQGYGKDNKSTLGELLFQFFRYYGYEFAYFESVASVRQGRILTRQEKEWTPGTKDGNFGFCIEEPFNVTRNLGNSADDFSFRGIHLELRDGFINICNLRLDKLLEEYKFPAEDRHTTDKPFYQKAPAVPKPTLTAAPSTSGRKGSGSVRSRHGRSNQSGASSRRASAGSAYGARGPIPGYHPNNALHEFSQQVAQNWAILANTGSLNQHHQMYGNLQHGLGQQNYQMAAAQHAHAVAQGGSATQRDNGPGSTNVLGQRMYTQHVSPEQMANGATMLPYMFQTASADQAIPNSQSLSQDGPRTNPSSPSLTSSIPARRGLQRTSVSNGISGGSLRSQSQPARGLAQNMFLPYPIAYDINGYPYVVQINPDGTQTYQHLEGQYNYLALQQTANGAAYQPFDNQQNQRSQQKEYLGYYVENNAAHQIPTPSSSAPLPRSTSHTDLAHRRDKINMNLQPLNINGHKKGTRSPSPLGHARNFSTPLRSAPLLGGSATRVGPSNLAKQSVEQNVIPSSEQIKPNGAVVTGLGVIVNGSSFVNSNQEHDGARGGFSNGYPVTTPDENSRNFFESTSTPPSDGSISQHGSAYNSVEFQREQETTGLSYLHTPRMDGGQVLSTVGSPMQPFPSYNDMMSPLASAEEEVVTSPTRQHQSPWQSLSPNISIKSPNDSHKDAQEIPKTPSFKSTPVLSPVIENRIPTPQMQRRIDSGKQQQEQRPAVVNGNLVNGGLVNGNISYRPSDPVPPTPATFPLRVHPSAQIKPDIHGYHPANNSGSLGPEVTIPSPPVISNPWQTTGSTKKKNRKRSKSGPATRSVTDGQQQQHQNQNQNQHQQTRRVEPLPSRPEDRKGG